MNSYQFSPTIRLTLFCGIVASILAAFGVWQLDRAAEKEGLQEAVETRTKMPMLQTKSLDTAKMFLDKQQSEQLLHRTIKLEGHFDPEQQILLENIVHNTVNGYYVYTPLRLESNKAVLINRGWLPAGRTRADIPQIATPKGRVTIRGRLAKPRSKPIMPGELPPPDINSEQVWFYLDLEFLASKSQLQLLPLVVLQTSPASDKLLREWPDFDGKTGMHIGYAIQWFVFALAVLFAWITLSLSKKPSGPTKQQNVIAGAQNNA